MAKEPEYGEVTAAREQAATAPLPQETPEPSPEDIAATVATAAPAEQPAQQQAPEQQKPNMWRIPARYDLVGGVAPKPTIERLEDYGLLWGVLAADPNVDPVVRNIASLLSRGE